MFSKPDFAELKIRQFISEFTHISPENNLGNSSEKAWEEPLVGFASGEDPLFIQIKEHIGEGYRTPHDFLPNSYGESLSVISWALPATKKIKTENATQSNFASERWVRARNYGEEFNNLLRDRLVKFLQNNGYMALAPVLSDEYRSWTSPDWGSVSNWSERHVAYVCGLGTFGLCDGLITEVGKAVRFGSVITNAPLTPSIRNYLDIHEYCLYFSVQRCGKCIRRCPAGAITENGHDKEKCRNYIRSVLPEYSKTYQLNLKHLACGLCQTGTPCESRIPAKRD